MLRYVLVTPARNEEETLPATISAVAAQTILPVKWVIVSDGSTDRTDEIGRAAALQFGFIEFISASGSGQRSFGSKVKAIEAGLGRLSGYAYDLIGNLDADVTFAPDYFEALVSRMAATPSIGIAGGWIFEKIDASFVPQNNSASSVAGAVQMFRRECFEQIGGYLPLPSGGIDAAAEILARMHGWAVRSYEDLRVLHHREVSRGRGSLLRERFRQGGTHYALGYSPVFQLLRGVLRLRDRPYVVGSACTLGGYVWAICSGKPHVLPDDAVAFLRKEQMGRLRETVRRLAKR
ncbi:MAG: glycosyltransferase family 2 protein [Deltaproteobacteria bacterium]|nr:glycosyltransferase family 2 protein [Deltaproteobacteria bacterium]